MSMVEAVDVRRVYRTSDAEVHALRGITLSISAGEYISLMGPSGSGKTTFFNMVGALDFPTSGEILLGGRNLSRLRQDELAFLRCANIGYIFQNYNLIEVVSALENVMLPMRFLGLGREQARDQAAALLQRVGLGHRLHHRPPELSGGQQQRVAIARALANRPRLILADEPTGNLDSATSLAIVELLKQLCVEQGATVVAATHDHRMLDVSDRVYYLRDGQIERVATRDQLQISIGEIA